MNKRVHIVLAFATALLCAGCAGPFGVATTTIPASSRDVLVVGKSSKADVIAALGRTKAVRFDSGYEVWVYQYKGDTPGSIAMRARLEHAILGKGTLGNTEFVLLFGPSGVLEKTRIRLPPTAG
jgi:hypothetical protein